MSDLQIWNKYVSFTCKRCNISFTNCDSSDMNERQQLSIKIKVHEQMHEGNVSDIWHVERYSLKDIVINLLKNNKYLDTEEILFKLNDMLKLNIGLEELVRVLDDLNDEGKIEAVD